MDAKETATATIAESGKNAQKTIYIDSRTRGGSLFGLGAVINILLLFAAWMIVGIGYICVPGSIAGAIVGAVCAFMNLGNGLSAFALCAGVAVACLGLCYPVFLAAQFGRKALAKTTKAAFSHAA